MLDIYLDSSWLKYLEPEFSKNYFLDLKKFLLQEIKAGKIIYPHPKNIFAAFNYTPFDKVKVVILGQDPYHGPGQAHGLSFSVPDNIPLPPSLKNIFKEIQNSVGGQIPQNGNLEYLASQGVLLLNSTLTVQKSVAGSHQNKGWETFTDKVIQIISDKKEGVIFLLWGAYAQKKSTIINEEKHILLKSPHPSPLSAHRGFFGCGHFLEVNKRLKERGGKEIRWIF